MQPKKEKQEELSDDEVAQQTKTFIGVNNPRIPEQAVKKEDLEYLHSDATWESLGVNHELALRLAGLGFKRPSLIQYRVIKLATHNSIVAQSQNGSGKTLAYLVPILNRAHGLKAKPIGNVAAPQVLILADTKALILQIASLIKRIAEGYHPLTVDYVFSGKTEVQKDTTILVSTIVQVRNLLQKKTLAMENIDFVVVDEADSVFDADLNRNFFQSLISKLFKAPNFKAIFTSATMTDNFRKAVQSFQEKSNVIQIELPVEKLTLKNVQQFMIECPSYESKREILLKLIATIGAENIVIFDNKKADLEQLELILTQFEYRVAYIYQSGSKTDAPGDNVADGVQRKITDFLAGKYRILLTTNLLSRGIDMRKVTLVINLSLPFKIKEAEGIREKKVDFETYLHRVGRTGRFGDKGIAVNFINNKEELGMMREVQDYYKSEILPIQVGDLKELDRKLNEIKELNKAKQEAWEENI